MKWSAGRGAAGRWATAVLVGVLLSPTLSHGADVGWDFVLSLPDPEVGAADVDWTLNGFEGAVRLCADMPNAARGVRQIRQISPGPPHALPQDGACWKAQAEAGKPLQIRYRYDLTGMAAEAYDPDYVTQVDNSYLFNDETVFLRPDPLPPRAPITYAFRLPEGLSVSTPWQRLEGPTPRFRSDSNQYDGGSYVALGRLVSLGDVKVKGGVGTVTRVERPHRASDATLKAWVSRSLGWVANFYGGVPSGRAHVVLVPVDSRSPGVFGTVLRHGFPSVVLFFGARAEDSDFERDWVAPHELFHMGNPNVEGRIAWFVEGFTTYYQDVLRARGGVISAEAAWSDLYDGFRRFCDPEEGVSLKDESAQMRRRHKYTRVYWGGACLAFRLDVAIREHSAGKQSLDTVLRELRRKGEEDSLAEEEIIKALDSAAGQPLARTHLEATEPPPLAPLYHHLGIEPTGPDAVRLNDEAPGAQLRKTIF